MKFHIAAAIALSLALSMAPSADASTRVTVRSIGEDWAVERVIPERAQKVRGKVSPRGGVERPTDAVAWLTGWAERHGGSTVDQL